MNVPDRATSRAVLIGASRFAGSSGLTGLPAVSGNVDALRRRLTDPDSGVLDAKRCVVATEPSSVAELGRLIGATAAEATDLLLVYYAGHGVVDSRGRLYLALHDTDASAPKYSGLGVDLLREDIGNSPATARVLVLDCCFSGRAIEVMAAPDGLITAQLDIAGTYTLTSTTANAPSYALEGEEYTAFTGALLHALDNPQPLTLDAIYQRVDRELSRRGLPRPQRRATNTAGALVLSRGPIRSSRPRPAPPGAARFSLDAATYRRRRRLTALRRMGFLAGVLSAGTGVLAVLASDPSILLYLLFYVPIPLILMLIFALTRPQPAELVIDSSGITRTAGQRRSRLGWPQVTQVGVLGTRRSAGDPERYPDDQALVVRLGSGIATSHTFDPMLPTELARLGYASVGRLADFGATRDEVLVALQRVAPDRVARSDREFLERDPRLRQDLMYVTREVL